MIKDFGDYELIFGNGKNNTLTGGTGANAFVHQGATNDVIKDYNPSEDVIILAKGKVAESLTSADDVILKIADGNNNLGTITVQNATGNFITIQDEEQLNERKKILSEFTNAYVKSAIKTFEEDKDIQNILTKGENSAVLAEIKAVNPEVAAHIATALKLSYESGIAYLERNSSETASHNVIETKSNFAQPLKNSDRSVLYYASSNVNTDNLKYYNDLFSQVDYYTTILGEVSNLAKASSTALNFLSRCAGALSVATAFGTCILYDAMLYSENVQGWQNAGSQGNNLWQKLALIRDQNSKIFDGAAKSHIDLAFAIGGFVTLGIMGVAGATAAPVILTASVFAAAPFVVHWAYDKFIANKLGDEANKFHEAMKNNFNDSISEVSKVGDVDDVADRWMSAIGNGSDYGKTNYKKYVAPHYYYMEVYDNGSRYISNGSVNYVRRKYKDSSGEYWDHPKYKVYYTDEDGNTDWYWKYVYDANGDHPTVSGDGAFLTGGASDDTISNYGDSVKIIGGAGNDSIINRGSDVIINGGAGNDLIINSGDCVTIDAGAGNDYINSDSSISIDAGEGKNTVYSGSYSTIKTGKGNDSIRSGSNSLIDAGEGNNTIYGGNGSNSTIKTGSEDDYIRSGSNSSIDAGEGNNTIISYDYNNYNNTIKTGSGDDFISLDGGYNLIDAGEGNNTVLGGYHNNNSTIKTGKGNDYIHSDSNSSIDAGEGNNTVYGSGMIKTGKGDDSIRGSGLIETRATATILLKAVVIAR